MSTAIRIPRRLYEDITRDLARRHGHAWERVGFLFAKRGTPRLALAHRYLPVPDEHYIQDSTVGARINGAAIRAALQHVLTTGDYCFHVHMHETRSPPWFSGIDIDELTRLMPSFVHTTRGLPHGAIVVGHTSAAGLVWTAAAAPPEVVSEIAVIGYPLEIWRNDVRT